MVECELGKNWLNNFICHLSWFKKCSPTHPLFSIHDFSKPYELLFFEFESFVKCKIWIVKKSHNNFTCHLSWLRNLCPIHTHPLISICKFSKPYKFFFSWVWVIHKMLNMNCKKQITQQFYLSLIIP